MKFIDIIYEINKLSFSSKVLLGLVLSIFLFYILFTSYHGVIILGEVSYNSIYFLGLSFIGVSEFSQAFCISYGFLITMLLTSFLTSINDNVVSKFSIDGDNNFREEELNFGHVSPIRKKRDDINHIDDIEWPGSPQRNESQV